MVNASQTITNPWDAPLIGKAEYATSTRNQKLKRKKVLVVDAHPLYSDALVRMIEDIVGMNGVVTAQSAELGFNIARHMPALALILLDDGCHRLKGATAIKTFRKHYPQAAIIAMSLNDDKKASLEAIRAGAIAFFPKTTSLKDTYVLIEDTLAGRLGHPQCEDLDPSVSSEIRASIDFTIRQREILTMLMQGRTNREISLALGLAEVTVKLHNSNIFRILGVLNRTQAVIAARRLGLNLPTDFETINTNEISELAQ